MPNKSHILMAAVLLGLATPAVAQDSTGSQLTQVASTNPSEMIQRANDAVKEMEDAFKAVQAQTDQAVKGNEPPEVIECTKTKQDQIGALVTVAKKAESALTSALAAAQEAKADHEFRKIEVALTKTRQFLAEAQACQGDGVVEGAQTEVTVDEDLDSTDDSDGLGINDDGLGIDPPSTTPFN